MGVGEVEFQQGLSGQELLGHCEPGSAVRLWLRVPVVLVRHHRLGDGDRPAAVPDDIPDEALVVVIGDVDLAVLVRLLGQAEAGAGVDLDIEGSAFQPLLRLAVRLADDDLRVPGVGKDEGEHFLAAVELNRLPVSVVDEIAVRGLDLTHGDGPGLLVLVEVLAVGVMVNDDGSIRTGRPEGTDGRLIDLDLEHGASQGLLRAGRDLLNNDFGVVVVDEGQGVDQHIRLALPNGDALALPVGKQIAIGRLDFDKIVGAGLQPIAVGAGEGKGTIRASGSAVDLGAIEVDIEHGSGQAVAALVHLLDNDRMLGLVDESDRPAAFGNRNTLIVLLDPEAEVLCVVVFLVTRRRDLLSDRVLARLDVVLTGWIRPLKFQRTGFVASNVHVDGVGGQLLEVEGSRADTVAVLVHLVDHAGGRSTTLAVLDGRAAVDSRCGLLGGVVGGADGHGVAFAVGDIAGRGGGFFEMEGLGGGCHILNKIVSPLRIFRFEAANRILMASICIDCKGCTTQSLATHISLLDLDPAFFGDRFARHDNDHGLIITLVGVRLVEVDIPIAIDPFCIVVYSSLDPADHIFYRAGRDALVDRECGRAVAFLRKHALVCRIGQVADLACSGQPYGRLRNRSA